MKSRVLVDYLPENSDEDVLITIKCKKSDYHEIGIGIECLRSEIVPLLNKRIRDIADFRKRNTEAIHENKK